MKIITPGIWSSRLTGHYDGDVYRPMLAVAASTLPASWYAQRIVCYCFLGFLPVYVPADGSALYTGIRRVHFNAPFEVWKSESTCVHCTPICFYDPPATLRTTPRCSCCTLCRPAYPLLPILCTFYRCRPAGHVDDTAKHCSNHRASTRYSAVPLVSPSQIIAMFTPAAVLTMFTLTIVIELYS